MFIILVHNDLRSVENTNGTRITHFYANSNKIQEV